MSASNLLIDNQLTENEKLTMVKLVPELVFLLNDPSAEIQSEVRVQNKDLFERIENKNPIVELLDL